MIFYVSAATVFILDQVAKLFVVLMITPFSSEGRLTLIPHVLDLVHRTNNGAAFSLFTGHTLILSIISLIAVVFIFFWQRSIPKQETWMRVSMGLIWGGALGNLFDRIFRGGFVVDMIRVHWHEKDLWPVFNLADSFICIGVGLFILLVLIHKKEIGGYEKEE